ncbi:MAG: ABC transporter ATP-binding protein, partial [Gimesia sp.]|nr:ABC transporter ATP-binding protein [Gimesia sp.]
IIGENGAGKSTLLQIICGTMAPSSGSVNVNGRVAALLELGSGFNPEFTGRENVFMNGAILGLTREEVEDRFDTIAAFADIGDFIDQPVKCYSSGMYVRLAFAVIAHVDADVLIIDEALAVGDAIFSQKCMRFIRTFKQKGTLIFVSHDMSAVLNLCESAVWLVKGKVRATGEAKQISEEYQQYTLQEEYSDDTLLTPTKKNEGNTEKKTNSTQTYSALKKKSAQKNKVLHPVTDYYSELVSTNNYDESSGWKTGDAEILDVALKEIEPSSELCLKGGERVKLVIKAKTYKKLENPILGFLVKDRLGQILFGENTLPKTNKEPVTFEAGESFLGEFTFTMPMLPNGQYSVMTSVADGNQNENIQHHLLHDSLILNVSSSTIRWGLVGIPIEEISLRASQ